MARACYRGRLRRAAVARHRNARPTRPTRRGLSRRASNLSWSNASGLVVAVVVAQEMRQLRHGSAVVAGAVLDRSQPRIVSINGYGLDLPPEGVAILIWRAGPDRPRDEPDSQDNRGSDKEQDEHD